jgi:hypothetical protein
MTYASLVNAQRLLSELDRHELAALIHGGTYTFAADDEAFLPETIVELNVAPLCADAIRALTPDDCRRLAEAIAHTDSEAAALGIAAPRVSVCPDESIQIAPNTNLLCELIIQRKLMVDVATNNVLINSVNDYYRARRRRIHGSLQLRGMDDPVPFDSLWDWYNHWSKYLPSYRERRAYVRNLFQGTIKGLLDSPQLTAPVRAPTGWERVDRALQKARHRLSEARNEEDWQGVGLLCRETLISLAQAVYDPGRHESPDGIVPSDTDARRMLEAFIAIEVVGASNESVRRHAKASLALGSELVHTRTADRRRALLCIEATQSTVAVIAILAGRSTVSSVAGEQPG